MSKKGIMSRGVQAVSDGLYDLSCRLEPKKQSKSSYAKRKKSSAMRFYCIMIAFPVFQFVIMWLGVNINSILLAFKEINVDYTYTWSLANFEKIFEELTTHSAVQDALVNSTIFWLCTNIITFPTSLGISYYLYRNYKFSKYIKTVLFLPSVISGPVTAIVIYQLFDRGFPYIVNALLGRQVMGLLTNPETQLAALIGYQLVYSLAGNFIFLSSAMSGIDESVSEAARIDGASSMQEFFHVTLPMIWPTVSIFLVTTTVSIFTGDYGMYSFYKVAGVTGVNTMGFLFTRGLTEYGEMRWPYYAALGLILTAMSCVIVFPLRAFVNSKDPMKDTDGAIAAKKRMRKENRRNGKKKV